MKDIDPNINQANNKIKTIISEFLGHSKDEINQELKLIEDLGADSLDVVEILMAIEEKFDVEINDEDAEQIKTVGGWFEYADKHGLTAKQKCK